MSGNPDQTFVGKTPAGPKDEKELLVRLAVALQRARTADLDDKDVTYATADVLDRANYILESSVDVTVLAGAEGTFVNGRSYDIEKERPELADELRKGMATRGLAGLSIGGALSQSEVRALLSAWKVVPSGAPKASLARFKEVLALERSGHGLPDPAPLEIVVLPQDGKLPIPATPLVAGAVLPSDDDDSVFITAADGAAEDPAREELAKLARKAPAPKSEPEVPHNRTLVKKSGDVIAEDLAPAKKADSGSSWVAKGDSSVKASSWVKGGSGSGTSRSWLEEEDETAKEDENPEDEYRSALAEFAPEPVAKTIEKPPEKAPEKAPEKPAPEKPAPPEDGPIMRAKKPVADAGKVAPKKAPPTPLGTPRPPTAAAPVVSDTLVGKKTAGPAEELELVVRLSTALRKRQKLDETDRAMVDAIADLLDRANFLLSSSGEVTILAGPGVAYVNDTRFDLATSHPEVAKDLGEGAARRGLAGFTFSGILETNDARALLSAWKVEPKGSPRESLARFREVLEGERQGFGLPEPGPIETIALPADGKLPAPAGAKDAVFTAPPAPETAPEKPVEKPVGEKPVAEKPSPKAPEKPAAEKPPAKAPEKPVAEKPPEPAPEKRPPKVSGKAAEKKPAPPPPAAEPISGSTMVGAKVAGPAEERELLLRLGAAFLKRKTLDESDREVLDAVVDVLDRANFLIESAGGKLTILFGAAGALIENRRYDLSKSRPEVAKELAQGAAARNLAGFTISGVLDQNEVKSLLSAWKVNPTGSPKASFSRFREVLEGERQGFGLPEPGPIKLVALPSDGKLPLPADVLDVPDADPTDDPDVEKKASDTAVRSVSEVIGEDLADRAHSSGVRRAMAAAGAAPESSEGEKSDTAVKKSADVDPSDVEDLDAEDLLSQTHTPIKLPRPGTVNVDDLSPESTKATLAYARLCARASRAMSAGPAEYDRSLAAVRRAVVEILKGLENTYYEDRLLALTAFPPTAQDARARHAANTAIYVALAARTCGASKVQLADLVVAAALHDDGDIESGGKADKWPKGLQRALETSTVSDLTLVRSVMAFERTGPRGTVARPSPGQKSTRLESRLVACACAFDDSLTGTSERAGARPDLTLERLVPAGHDPVATRALGRALGKYPRGTLVSVTPHGHLAVVLACGGRREDKPRVRIFATARGDPVPAREVELGQSKEHAIDRVEDPGRLRIDPRAHLIAWG
jgi:outer membrane biosynthesis protein TonB